MPNSCASTLQHKEAVIIDVLDKLSPLLTIDIFPEDIVPSLSEAIAAIALYPGLEEIKQYPLGRMPADYKAVDIQKSLCVCLSGHGNYNVFRNLCNQLIAALDDIQGRLQQSAQPSL